MSTPYSSVLARIEAACVASGRAKDSVHLIAVSKTQSADAVEALYRLGQRDFGENYAQELLEKASELEKRGCTGIRWHMIGHLQTNKVKSLIRVVASIHSVDSLKLAVEISKRRAAEKLPAVAVFIEVNVDREESKSGIAPERAAELAREIAALPALELRGLMAVPMLAPAAAGMSGDPFAELRKLELSCRPATRGELSMGMSGDFEKAIAQGATHVRVGTALFGERSRAK